MHTYSSGTFIVGSSGEVDVDFLLDGGWFRGELAIFSLDGMEKFTPGSTEFLLEAGRRALTDSEQGRIINQDQIEGARFSSLEFNWERDFNGGDYLGAKSFMMTPGDEVALLMIQHKTVQETVNNPERINEFGRLPLFSIPEANIGGSLENQFEFVEIGDSDIIGGEDMRVFQSDRDYNDFVFQFRGMDGNFANLEDHINPTRNWLTSEVGANLLEYAQSRVINEQDPGVFQVGESGEVNIDFLYDGGLYEGTVGIFSLEDINPEDLTTEEFTRTVVERVQSNSTEGHIVVRDAVEGARYTAELEWEQALPEGMNHFNDGDYLGTKTFTMNPGDNFAVVMIPDGNFNEAIGADESFMKKDLIFSMHAANFQNQVQFVDVKTSPGGTIISFEDDRIDLPSNEDYNDVVLAIEGIQEPIGLYSIEERIFPRHDWTELPIGQENILPYFDSNEQLSSLFA